MKSPIGLMTQIDTEPEVRVSDIQDGTVYVEEIQQGSASAVIAADLISKLDIGEGCKCTAAGSV